MFQHRKLISSISAITTQQELHTTLVLEGEGLEEGMTINMGWAMNIASEAEIPMGETEFENLDGQGSSRQ